MVLPRLTTSIDLGKTSSDAPAEQGQLHPVEGNGSEFRVGFCRHYALCGAGKTVHCGKKGVTGRGEKTVHEKGENLTWKDQQVYLKGYLRTMKKIPSSF